VPHNPVWLELFAEEQKNLRRILRGDNLVDIQHVGSTSIPGIAAKPVMGVLAIVKNLPKAKERRSVLEANGYHFREDFPENLLFAKGPEHHRTVHLHIAEQGSDYADITLLFRDYLIAHPKVAKKYEEFKKELAAQYADERKKYTAAKDRFIKEVIKKARAEAGQSKNWGEL
jgi:GrpB-like predicted nucleotidyltransferase (UPF0157 family)